MSKPKTLPTHLGHKPIFAVLDYDKIDGPYAGDTDTVALSAGLACWDKLGRDVSVKVWRFPGTRWSRQSEELPPHRAFDLTILYCLVLLCRARKQDSAKIQAGNFEFQISQIRDAGYDPNILARMLEKLDAYIKENREYIKERLEALSKVLDELKKEGIF